MDLRSAVATKRSARPEFWLIGLAVLTAVVSWIFTWLSIVQDRDLSRAASVKVAETIALNLDEHVAETLRAAKNTLRAAAVLIERNGGPRSFSADALQRELDRELPEKASIKRLVVLDRDANSVATSDAHQLPSIRVQQREFYQWHLARPTDTSIHLSAVIRTTVHQEWVVPISRAIIVNGHFEGVIVAQLDVRYFEAFYRRLASLYPATLGVTNADGLVLFRYPFDDSIPGRDLSRKMDWGRIREGGGTLDHFSDLDGRKRFVSHRTLDDSGLVVLVGLDAEQTMAPWRARALRRVIVVALASVVFFTFVGTLVAFLRRLSRSEARFRHLYASANEGIIVIRKGCIGEVNPAGLAILGYTRTEEMIGRSPAEFSAPLPNYAPSAAVTFSERLAKALAGEQVRYEVTLLRRDGSAVTVESSLSTVEDRGETLVISMFRDVTERKRNEAELKRLASELEARVEQRTSQLSSMVRELESFSYTVSHDLRAPVRHMRGYSAALLSDFANQLPRECVRMLNRIEASGERIDALITGLLDLSKVSRDALKLRRCDISAIAAAAIGTQRELDPARRVRVEIEPGLNVEADRGMLEALIGNLVSNAWKFTAKTASPHITLGRTSLWGQAVFYVRDNGAGFDMAGAHRLYEPFRRLHPVDEYPGTGIGLATVHRIVERHGGGIEVESAPGKGTTFYFSLGKAEEALALG